MYTVRVSVLDLFELLGLNLGLALIFAVWGWVYVRFAFRFESLCFWKW